MNWKNCTCQTSPRILIPDVNLYVGNSPTINISSIDRFYNSTEDILTKITPTYFTSYTPEITSLLYIGLISATENYFRDILGFILSICPIARENASEEKVQLGSFLWGGSELHNRTAFDFIAFSSSRNIKETINKFINYQIAPKGTWSAMLSEYDKLCEIRHGIVHSGHVLSGKNALKLGLTPTKLSMKTNPSYATLQEAGSICTTLTQSANNELFELLVDRWAKGWRRLPSWDPRSEYELIKKLYLGFHSDKDFSRGRIANPLTIKKLAHRIRKDYGI